MNSVTFFVVAVAAFTLVLESSATPAAQAAAAAVDDTVYIDEEFIQLAHEAIEGAKSAFDGAQTVVGDALINATGEKKDILEEINEWLDVYLGGTVGGLSEELLKAIDCGSVSALEEVNANIKEAIVYTSETMDGFNDKLPEGDTKDGLNAEVNTILELSARVSEGLDGILAGVNA